MSAMATQKSQSLLCPDCGQKGVKVQPVTLQSLLKPEAKGRIGDGSYRFCEAADCDTIFYPESGDEAFTKSDLTVRVGIKETEAPRHVCYCFDHTIEEIEDEVKRTGKCTVPDDIKARMKEACWCETMSPRGSCCLGTVNKFVKGSMAKFGARDVPDTAQRLEPSLDGNGKAEETEDCCAAHRNPAGMPAGASRASRFNVGKFAQIGALGSAIIASACCWLPLLLIAVGVSGGALSATFEAWRPVLLPVTFALLGAAF